MTIPLSDYEMSLVTDPNVLLAKNTVIKKVYELFGRLSEDYKKMLQAQGMAGADNINAKISRGENYRGLPYVILDYPRNFSRDNVFAIRTFFWWGNFFSVTLHLQGEAHLYYSSKIQAAIETNNLNGWWMSCGKNPWEHHFEDHNYELLNAGNIYEVSTLPYIKIAKKIPLREWDKVEIFIKENYQLLINVLVS